MLSYSKGQILEPVCTCLFSDAIILFHFNFRHIVRFKQYIIWLVHIKLPLTAYYPTK